MKYLMPPAQKARAEEMSKKDYGIINIVSEIPISKVTYDILCLIGKNHKEKTIPELAEMVIVEYYFANRESEGK